VDLARVYLARAVARSPLRRVVLMVGHYDAASRKE